MLGYAGMERAVGGWKGWVTVMLMQFVHHSPTVHQEYTNMMVKMRLTMIMIIEMRVGTSKDGINQNKRNITNRKLLDSA